MNVTARFAIHAALWSFATLSSASASLDVPKETPNETSSSFPTQLFLGTGGLPHTSGMTFPGATTPFGLVRLSPDTRIRFPLRLFSPGGQSTAGYGYRDQRIYGFSHNRLSGTGVKDGGAFRVLPVQRLLTEKKAPRSVRFRHQNEVATPGYYSVILPEQNTSAELTATPHCGVHRYKKLNSKKDLALIVDVSSALERGAGEISSWSENVSTRVFQGGSLARGDFANRQGGVPTYFYAEWSEAPASTETWKQDQELRLRVRVAKETQEIELKLCLSHVSAKNAKLNFESEVQNQTFETLRSRAHQTWNQYFSRILIQTPDQNVRRLFYSSLYFASVMPTLFTDVNGEYLAFNKKIKQAKGFQYRTDLSLWDTFRTAHPLYQIIAPEIQRDSVLSLMDMGKEADVFPRWAFAAADSKSMFGSPANFVISEAYQKGIRDFDPKEALAIMVKGVLNSPETREPACHDFGYCPADQVKKSVSKTLEYAWSDFAAAELARAIGDTPTENFFREKEIAFRKLWDPSTRFFRPKKADGSWERFNPSWTSYFEFLYKPARHYAEGGPHHYRYSAPHYLEELIDLFGGREAFVKELDNFVRGASRKRAALNPGAKYWHGNEHNLHALYLFNGADRPDLTQKWVRWALRDRYAATPNGLDGNDDGGTLTAWYVLSAMGLYPQAGTDRYWLGSPAVDSIETNSFKIVANGASRKIYVREVRINGTRWCKPEIRHHELNGATLEFEMSDSPQPTFQCRP